MNKPMIVGVALGALAVTAVGSIAGYSMLKRDDYSAVEDDTPIVSTSRVSTSRTREVCRDVVVSHQKETKDPNQIAGTITGAIVGGVIGHQIGDGRGQDIATVGGAVAGGYAGNKIQEDIQSKSVTQSTERVCETVEE
jgi:uncharacterized protein YcfJ